MARKPLIVVAAALIAPNGAIMVQRRPAHKQHGGLWEFPGGKLEEGEDSRAALSRELAEELGIAVRAADLSPLSFATGALEGGGEILLLLFRCARWTGDPRPLDASELRWAMPADLPALPMPPVDVPLALELAAGA